MAQPAHILVADDVPDICELIRAVLVDAGHVVTCVHDGAEARRMLEAGGVDLAILDILMPVEGGAQLAELAHSRGIPAILMSGEPHSMEWLSVLPHAHIRKPFRTADLVTVVNELLAGGTKETAAENRNEGDERDG